MNKMHDFFRKFRKKQLSKFPYSPNINDFSQTENGCSKKQSDYTANAYNKIQSCKYHIANQSNRWLICNFNNNGRASCARLVCNFLPIIFRHLIGFALSVHTSMNKAKKIGCHRDLIKSLSLSLSMVHTQPN